jgi:hypothetical protein
MLPFDASSTYKAKSCHLYAKGIQVIRKVPTYIHEFYFRVCVRFVSLRSKSSSNTTLTRRLDKPRKKILK